MPALTTPTFRGMLPIRADHFLDETQAVEATNCFYDHGTLQPFSDIVDYQNDVLTVSNPKSFYYWEWSNKWLSWSEEVDVVGSPIGNDQYHRIYFTGTDAPRYYRTTSSGDMDYILGVPPPERAPTILLQGTGDVGDDITEVDDDETRVYVHTYVTDQGEEGAPSPPSDYVTVTRPWDATEAPDGEYVDLTFSAITEEERKNRNITKRRVYRSVSTSAGADFLLVVELDVATLTYSDKKKTLELGYALVSDQHYPPSENMIGLTSMPNGVLAGYEGNVLMFSEPSLPYAWNPSNQLVVDSEIVGIGSLATGGVVVTKGQPYLISGYTPDSMQLIKLDAPYGCKHTRSIVDFGEAILYVSDVGLVSVSSSGANILTEQTIDKAEWQSMLVDWVHSYRWKDNYIMYVGEGVDKKGYMFSIRSGDMTEIPHTNSTCWQPEGTDELLIAIGKDVKRLKAGIGTGQAFWKGKEYHTPPVRLSSVIVRGGGTNEFAYYRDGVEVHRQTVEGFETVFRLPDGIGTRHQFELKVNGYVEYLSVATSVPELFNG